jgi:hypothetical protein
MQNRMMPRIEIVSCLFALSVLLFANILIYLSDVHRESKISDGLASWWLTKAYFAEPEPPDIVLLGSSQLGPIIGADVSVYKKPVDITGDHRSRVLEQDLYGLLGKHWRVFIGALPEAMISDQLAISRALFSKEYKPQLVAVTFSPRDFIDDCFPSATATEAYTFFSKYTDPMLLRNNLDKARTKKNTLKQTSDYGSENKPSLFLGEPFERISPGEIVIRADDDYVHEDNTEEYKLRYKNPMSSQFDMQLNYFATLLKYLAAQHIQVVAFNFPISAANRKLLPDKFWKYYYERIDEVCRKNGAHFISADRVVLPFKENEFIDGVHLDLVGGHRWSKTVAVFIANKYGPKTYQQLLTREKYLK